MSDDTYARPPVAEYCPMCGKACNVSSKVGIGYLYDHCPKCGWDNDVECLRHFAAGQTERAEARATKMMSSLQGMIQTMERAIRNIDDGNSAAARGNLWACIKINRRRYDYQ